MVAERYLVSAYQFFLTPARALPTTMANLYLRGAQIATGGAFMRSASAGAILVGVAGGVIMNRARVWCQQRRGRQPPDTSSHTIDTNAVVNPFAFVRKSVRHRKFEEGIRQFTSAVQAITGCFATTGGQRGQMGEDNFGLGRNDEES